MKNLKVNKKLLAILVASGISTSFAGCSNTKDSNEKETVSADTVTSMEVTSSTTLSTELDSEILDTIVSKEYTEKTRDNEKGVFVNGNENDYNFYVESGNVYIYGDDLEPNYETETSKSSVVKETVVTTVPTTVKEAVVTTVPTTTKEAIVTTVPTTTKEAVVTTVPTTVKETTVTTKETEMTGKYSNKEIDLNRFEELTDNLYVELKSHNIVKSSGKLFTRADLYSTVYIYNIDFISDELKQTLIDRGYIPDDASTLMVDAASVRDAITTYNQSRMILNTNIDEVLFAMQYLGYTEKEMIRSFDGELLEIDVTYDYNPTNKVKDRAINKIRALDIDEYYDLKNEFDAKYPINATAIAYFNTTDNKSEVLRKDQLGVTSYEMDDFVDISVAVNDKEAKENVYKSLKISVNASLDNTKAVKTLNDFSNFYMGDKTCTTLTDCGAGATFAINTNALAYSRFMGYNVYKNLRGFTTSKEKYEQVKVRFKILEETCQELNDVMKIHESCNIQYKK